MKILIEEGGLKKWGHSVIVLETKQDAEDLMKALESCVTGKKVNKSSRAYKMYDKLYSYLPVA